MEVDGETDVAGGIFLVLTSNFRHFNSIEILSSPSTPFPSSFSLLTPCPTTAIFFSQIIKVLIFNFLYKFIF